jgi:threonine-phosphate decarboxylase
MTYIHGGNVYEVASCLGCSPDAILDYSASINPLGPPPGLFEEFGHWFHRLQHYPDIANRKLVEGLAGFHHLPENQVVVGNGSTELIYWLPKALGIRSAMIALPAFSEYGKAFEIQGVRLHKLFTDRENRFQPTCDALETACRESSPDAVLLTNPGSPSGALLPPRVRDWLIQQSKRDGMVCIVDEVFVDFCEDASLKEFLREAHNLVLIRSMTKFYGVPGLRLGYLLTSPAIAGKVKHFLPPWSVNTLAQAAGAYCLGREDYRKETLGLIARERERLAEGLSALEGFEVFPGEANYLLVRLKESLPAVDFLQKDLLESGRILIRDCRSFEGLDERYFRLAVRLPEQNDRVLEGIARWAGSIKRQ